MTRVRGPRSVACEKARTSHSPRLLHGARTGLAVGAAHNVPTARPARCPRAHCSFFAVYPGSTPHIVSTGAGLQERSTAQAKSPVKNPSGFFPSRSACIHLRGICFSAPKRRPPEAVSPSSTRGLRIL